MIKHVKGWKRLKNLKTVKPTLTFFMKKGSMPEVSSTVITKRNFALFYK